MLKISVTFGRNIAKVTPKTLYFYYQQIYLWDQSTQKKLKMKRLHCSECGYWIICYLFTLGISHGYILVEGESTCSRLRAFARTPSSPTAPSDWGSALSRGAAPTHARVMNSITIAEIADMARMRSFLVPYVVAVILSKMLPAPCVDMSCTYHQRGFFLN